MFRRVFHLFRVRVRTPLLPTATTTTTTARLRTVPLLPRQLHTSPPRLSTPPLPAGATVSQRLKHLVKSYGWYALGVYLVFSALDFTVAFVGIKLLGAEQVSQATAYVKQVLFGLLHTTRSEPGREEVESDGGHEGLYAMLALAYTIHKTVFLPVRVGLTAALTPRIVGWLRARGWAGGEGAKQAVKERIRNTRNGD